jgi:hypothetical protein
VADVVDMERDRWKAVMIQIPRDHRSFHACERERGIGLPIRHVDSGQP